MKQKTVYLLLLTLICISGFTQEFHGAVKKNDSLSSSIFQARIDIIEGEQLFSSLKTYFDGGYKFKSNKNQTYTIQVSYPGYLDTAFTIKTDKNAKPFPEYVVVKLKKDGMRLIGVIKSAEENFPIKDAAIILKNVMTREEKRIYTGIDGAYNFKLDYETNYKISIDKRSLGIFNKYKDTSFYLSTIGFNQPLDYKLDIVLDPVLYPNNSNSSNNSTRVYSTNKTAPANVAPPANTSQQPFLEDSKKQAETNEAIIKLQAELEATKKQLEELKKKETEKKSSGAGISLPSNGRKRAKDDPNLEVVIIRDEVQKNTETDKSLTANSAKPTEASVYEEKKKAEALAAMQQEFEDSVEKARETDINTIVSSLNLRPNENKNVLPADTTHGPEKKQFENTGSANSISSDSVHNISVAAIDTNQAKDVTAGVTEIKRTSIQDSISNALQELKRKLTEDSIAKANAEKEKATTAIEEKKKEDTLIAVRTDTIITAMADSVKENKPADIQINQVVNEQKLKEDSATQANAAFLIAESNKKREDSITKATEMQRIAEEAKITAAKQMLEDSLNKLKQTQERVALETSAQVNKLDSTVVLPTPSTAKKNNTEKVFTSDMPVILFDKNSYDLNSELRNKIKSVVAQLIGDSRKKVKIYALGSTDEENPRQISLWRSDAVLRQLINDGINIDRIKSSYFGNNISRNGCSNAACPEELQKQNRCVIFEILQN